MKNKAMADEEDELPETELSYDQKKEIAKWFLLNAPAGEINYVAKDLKAVLSDEEVYNEAAMEAFPVYNKSHMICLEMPNRAGDVIVSSYSEITENEYLDPRTAQVAIVDHVKQICTKVRPADDEELASSYIEEFRCALDAEIQRYVSESYPKGVSVVNCVKGKDADGPGTNFEFVVIITARKLSPQNFCNGSWRSVWNIDFQDESQVLDIKGKLQVGAHYFEEGNVELDAKKEFQDSTIFQSADDCAIAIANIIRHHETEYLAALEVAYSKLPDNTFKDLRRKLPVTRTLFPWQNTLQFSLTREVEKELGLGNIILTVSGASLPLSLLKTAQGHPMLRDLYCNESLVELKNGETYNGHLVNCDTWMNIHLREVICTSKDGDRFWRMPECYIRGNTIKYLRVPDEVIDKVQEEKTRTENHQGLGEEEEGKVQRLMNESLDFKKQISGKGKRSAFCAIDMATPMVEDTSSFEEDQLASMSTEDIVRATRLLENEIRILKEDAQRTNLECDSYKEKIKENQEKIKLNKQLPYLVGNIVEILEMNPEDDAEEDGANIDLDSQRKGKCVVLKTSTRQTIFLPVVGLVDPDSLKPGDLVGVNKDSYLILDTLPSEYDSRVKAMEVDEKPTEDYNDIGGLEKQIQELVEAIVLPMTHKERFEKLGVRPPKGVLLYGPPGTGKTLMARACAAQTNATFLKLAGPQLVQMFIGDGAKLVRDAFQLAKEKAPCIIFIDEIDAIGTKRFDSEVSGDREVQRTMLELLNQLDGFSSDERIKVIAATNRADILDPALMRSGRLDRKIEFPHPTEEARARILQIHSRKMNVHPDVNFEELARSTDDFNGAQLKAVCVEAGMLALRRDATEVNHEDFNEGIIQVQAKKKASLNYYA
ncbi:hypothetical protein HID58_044643 [Brassica napus]|nr:hypothetical protein HID58_044643 [Brassica napus]